MSRFFIAPSIGLALLAGISGCSSEQGATVAPSSTPVASGDATSNDAKLKLKTAGQQPTVNLSPVQ